jgi:hypothetical protein
MTPRTTIATALVTGLAVIGAGTVAAAAPGQQQTRAGQTDPAGVATQAQQHDPTTTLPAPADQLDPQVEQMLIYLVEEEKLAHDLYATLAEDYDARQFTTIATSESRHVDAVRVLLDRYQLTDPTVGAGVGQFTDPDLAELYAQLLASGQQSLADAAQAGITVEQTDITDLEQMLAATDAEDVQLVLTSLLDGSRHHLAAFERLADRT